MNSPQAESKSVTEQPITEPLQTAPSGSAEQQLQQLIYNEAPLLSLPPGASLLAPEKTLVDMTDVEIQQWHAKLREHRNYQTMQSHIAATSVTVTKKISKTKQDISEFI